MTLKVIELNDNALRVGDESGVLLESPGFALAVDKQLQFGELAKQQARIQPSNSYNRYLHELSLDPISHAVGFRHAADIAYAHLLRLAEETDTNGEVIFAVPGNFTRQQLAILLGLAKQTPFQVIGMVDSALVAANTVSYTGTLVYAEMQLHQVVLTKLIVGKDSLQRESVIQVPGVGSQNFMDLMMDLVTSLFIEQCRFNPQHDAGSEQQLYNALPAWLENDDKSQSSLLLELKANTAVYTAKMPRESLVKNLSKYYKSISQQLVQLATDANCKLLLSSEFAALPGFRSFLGDNFDLQELPDDAICQAVILNQDNIANSDGHIQLVTSLPRTGSSIEVANQSDSVEARLDREQATHALLGSTAIPLGEVNLPALGQIKQHDDGFYLDSGKQEFLLNQRKVVGKHALCLGDLIQSCEDGEAIQLIQVSNV